VKLSCRADASKASSAPMLGILNFRTLIPKTHQV
jgi:hypothetical protein